MLGGGGMAPATEGAGGGIMELSSEAARDAGVGDSGDGSFGSPARAAAMALTLPVMSAEAYIP